MGVRHPRRVLLALTLVVATALLSPPAASAAAATDLDNGCFKLRVTTTGTTAGAANYIEKASVGYGTRGTVGTAEPIAFEATALGRYRLHDRSGALLYESTLDYVWAGSDYGAEADWTITREGNAYRIMATASGDVIGSRSGQLTVSDASFALEAATGCYQPASASTGRLSAATEPRVNADGTINGMIDAHAHLVSNAAFGGRLICGEPFAPGGIEDALAGCPSHTAGIGAVLETVIGGTDLFGGDDGWPTFGDWPTSTSILHQQAYYTGLERAWQGGLSVVNALLVGNRQICELYPERVSSCDEMDQVRVQAELLNEMQNYIDAQSGGPGKGWFRIAKTPAQVRQIVAQGKLAVTIGVEASETFGCRLVNNVSQCDESDIDAGLNEFQNLGISGLYPVHKFDNALGGTRFDAGATGVVINVANYLSTGRFWNAESCPTGPSDNTQLLSGDEAVAVLDDIAGLLTGTGANLPAGSLLPVYPSGPVCNTRGLSDLGEYLIEQMMDRGMIIHIDHMGVRTAQAVLDMAEDADYPGVVSVHTWSDRVITARTAQLSGFVAGYAYSAADAGNGEPDFVSEYRANLTAAGLGAIKGYGYGSDVNGLAIQPAPRLNAASSPLRYPFTTPNGATFGRQVTGQRTWDINTDGVAQYGLYADWYADLIGQAGSNATALKAGLMDSAEAYTQAWEGSRAWTD